LRSKPWPLLGGDSLLSGSFSFFTFILIIGFQALAVTWRIDWKGNQRTSKWVPSPQDANGEWIHDGNGRVWVCSFHCPYPVKVLLISSVYHVWIF
jgi:hypothetical protein